MITTSAAEGTPVQIYPIPAFDDNYFWLIQPDSNRKDAIIIDPGAAKPVIDALQGYDLQLVAILITHRHHDHVGGISDLLKHTNIPVYGPNSDAIPQITHQVHDGDRLTFGPLIFDVMETPGHTLDHLSYFSARSPDPVLFCGDTLFAGGCGRLFDGTAALLHQSLNRLANLPDNTLIYCAHEYTLANLAFGQFIEPDNQDIAMRIERETIRRNKGEFTIPSQLRIEKRTNPFLRCHLPQLKDRLEHLVGAKLNNTEEIFAALRRAKDHF